MEIEDENKYSLSEKELEEIKDSFNRDIWPKMKNELRGASKREACSLSFVAGCDLMMYMQEEEFNKAREKLSKMPDEEIAEMMKNSKGEYEGDELWSKGSFIKSINPNDPKYKEMKKYIEEKKDDKKEHNCKKCAKPIGKHNLYWHESMCNDCFFDENEM